MKIANRILSIFITAASVQLAIMPIASANEKYPERGVRMIVPFPPGGSVDYVARIIVPEFEKKLGASVFIENKGGASGAIGTADAARSKPDGYTLLMIFDTHAVNPHIQKNLSFDTFESFDYITRLTTAPMVVATSNKFKPKTLQAFIDYAKSNPGKVTYGSSGVGGSNHLTALALSKAANISTLHVPYKGGGPMLTALIGGEVDFVVTTYPLVIERIKSGQMNALAMGSDKRVSHFPDLPTVEETLPGYRAESWIGLVAPKGVPASVLEKIRTAMTDALNSPAIHERLTSEGFNIVPNTPAVFKKWVKEQSDQMGALIEDGSIITQ